MHHSSNYVRFLVMIFRSDSGYGATKAAGIEEPFVNEFVMMSQSYHKKRKMLSSDLSASSW